MTEVVVPELNGDQVDAILIESLNKKIYETPNGAIPENVTQKNKDAHDIVAACIAASNNGNKSEGVESILFIATVDMKPEVPKIVSPDPTIPLVGENNIGAVGAVDGTQATTNSTVDGLDITTLAPGVLDQLIQGLDRYPNSPQVEADRATYLAEKARRENKNPQQIQEAAPAAAQGEAIENSSEQQGGGGGGQVQAQDGAKGEQTAADASAFARAQTPETVGKGSPPAAKSAAQNEQRAKLEDQLTLPIAKAHGVKLIELEKLSIQQLEFIVSNPDGPPKTETKVPISEEEVEAAAIHSDFKGHSVGGISAKSSSPEVVVTKADLGLDGIEDETVNKSEEREKLEAMLKGTTLKVYGRGRKEVPSIGDNELRFMILNEDGKVTTEELAAAKAKDGIGIEDSSAEIAPSEGTKSSPVIEKVTASNGVTLGVAQEIPEGLPATTITLPSGQNIVAATGEVVVEPLADSIKISEENRSLGQAAAEAVDKNEILITQDVKDVYEKQSGIKLPSNEAPAGNRAMEIIKAENFAIPPSYKDEEAPQLPFDLSKCSRDELFSYHARFHAYESRMNWVLTQHEDELGDIEKLRRNREAEVAISVPFLGEDGKRNTNERRDAIVAGDKEVLSLGMKDHEIGKVVKRLRVLQKNYMKDCERISRQMSYYERERLDAPR